MILSDEHEDCENWGRWARHNDRPQLWYRSKWCLGNVLREWHVDEERLEREVEDAERKSYDERRAQATDRILQAMLACDRRHFRVIRAAYYLRMDMGELTVREALRSLKDRKDAQMRRAA